MPTPPLQGDAFARENAQAANLKVTAQETPGLTVQVSAGSFWTSGKVFVEYVGGNSPTLTAPTTDPKWVLIALADSGNIVLVDGTEATTPVFPDLPSSRLPLAAVYLLTTDTLISEDMVFDVRPGVHISLNASSISSSIAGLTTRVSSLESSVTANASAISALQISVSAASNLDILQYNGSAGTFEVAKRITVKAGTTGSPGLVWETGVSGSSGFVGSGLIGIVRDDENLKFRFDNPTSGSTAVPLTVGLFAVAVGSATNPTPLILSDQVRVVSSGVNAEPGLSFTTDIQTGFSYEGAGFGADGNIIFIVNSAHVARVSNSATDVGIFPEADVTMDLGSSAFQWNQIWGSSLYTNEIIAGSLVQVTTSGVIVAQFDQNNTVSETRFLIYDVDNATLERVSVGAADSGGVGFKVLRIPN